MENMRNEDQIRERQEDSLSPKVQYFLHSSRSQLAWSCGKSPTTYLPIHMNGHLQPPTEKSAERMYMD